MFGMRPGPPASLDSPRSPTVSDLHPRCRFRVSRPRPPAELNVVPAMFVGVSYSQERGKHMAKNEVYIERREQGDYAVRKPGSERASAVLPTQAAAIERAREIEPDSAVLVERVRDTNVGGRDKWRKV